MNKATAPIIEHDMSRMSPAQAEQIGAVTCNAVLNYFKQPGVQEDFERWLAVRQKRKEG